MNGTAIDTLAFDELKADEYFCVEPSPGDTLSVGDSVEIRPSEEGARVVPSISQLGGGPPPVEQVLRGMVAKRQESVNLRPRDPRLRLNLALALANSGQRGRAIEELKQVLEATPKDFVALNALASAHFNGGELGEAREVYQQMAGMFPNSAAAFMGLASIALRKGDFLEAARHLEATVSVDRRTVNAYLLLAMVQLRLSKTHQAISTLRQGLRENTRSAELNQALAIVCLCVGDLRRSEKAFRTALYLNPQLSSAIHGLALLLLHEKRIEELISLLSKRLDSAPDDVQSREFLAHAFVITKDLKRARAQLIRLVDESAGIALNSKDVARINNNIAYCFAVEAKYREAEHRLLLSLKVDPRFAPQPYENLARVYLAVGRTRDALKVIDNALDESLDSISLHELRASCFRELKHYDDAIEELRTLVQREDAPSSAFADLGWLLTEWQDDCDSAIAVLRQAMDRWGGDDPRLLNNLAYAHLMRGDSVAARLVLDLIPEGYGPEPYIVATRGLLKIREGDIQGGEADYNFAETLAARSGERDLALAIRQKKFLETAKEYMRQGRTTEGVDALRKGAEIEQNSQPYPFAAQLRSLLASVAADDRIFG